MSVVDVDLRRFDNATLEQLITMVEAEIGRRKRCDLIGVCDVCGAKDHKASTMERNLYGSIKPPVKEAAVR